MTLHQIFREEKVSDSRQNRDQQNADGAFTLVQQTLHQHEGALQVAGRQRVAQLENHPGPGERHQLTHLFNPDTAFLAQKEIDLFEFVVDLARVAAGQQHEEFERLFVELEL